MIGNMSNVHGYNPRLRDNGGGTRFDAFSMHAHHPNRPEGFHARLVQGTPYIDHQGHIIPQNAYAAELTGIAMALDNYLLSTTYNMTCIRKFFNNNFTNLHINFVTDYVEQVLIGQGHAPIILFVDQGGGNIEDRLGGFFSVINWNPVNICRAPGDDQRGGYPGNNPDVLVARRLLQTPAAPTITLPPPYQNLLATNAGNLVGNIDAFITACNDCLPAMSAPPYPPSGFYQFPWVVGAFPQ